MLRLISNNPENVTPRDVASAFAVSVHHHDVWDDLRTIGIFPLDMNKFPLACLLLQLDAVQEWGRRQIVSTETRLVGFSVTDRSVNFELVFESGATLGDKYEECQNAKKCIRSSSLDIYSDMNVRTRLSI
jgi:hypothetical protein